MPVLPIIAPVFELLRRFGGALRRGWGEPEFRGLLYLVSIVVGSGALFYRAVEGWGWVDSVYFTVITLTTVGYGDLHPTTAGSRIFTVVLILIGIGLLVSSSNVSRDTPPRVMSPVETVATTQTATTPGEFGARHGRRRRREHRAALSPAPAG